MDGIGIVVMSLLLLLLLGGSGYQVYKAEVPGLEADRIAPHIRDTARIVYYLITLLVTRLRYSVVILPIAFVIRSPPSPPVASLIIMIPLRPQ